jgi:hypothetical protein
MSNNDTITSDYDILTERASNNNNFNLRSNINGQNYSNNNGISRKSSNPQINDRETLIRIY